MAGSGSCNVLTTHISLSVELFALFCWLSVIMTSPLGYFTQYNFTSNWTRLGRSQYNIPWFVKTDQTCQIVSEENLIRLLQKHYSRIRTELTGSVLTFSRGHISLSRKLFLISQCYVSLRLALEKQRRNSCKRCEPSLLFYLFLFPIRTDH